MRCPRPPFHLLVPSPVSQWAEQREKLAYEASQMPTPPIAGPGSDVGLRLSNVGGFASWQDLFDDTARFDSTAGAAGDVADGAVDGTADGAAASGAAGGLGASRGRRDNSAEHTGRMHTRTLHAIVSAAVDEASGLHEFADGQVVPPGGKVPDDTVEGPADPPASSRGDTADGVLHAATAWINVNRSSDYNEMHVHPDRWSAVYYVDPGECGNLAGDQAGCTGRDGSPEVIRSCAMDGGCAVDGDPTIVSAQECTVQARGCMVFRTGRARRMHRTAAAAEEHSTSSRAARQVASWRSTPSLVCNCSGLAPLRAAVASHSFFQVTPAAGTLWLFPGRMPHMVMGQHTAATYGQARPRPEQRGYSRVSVAVNFSEVRPPPPRYQPLGPTLPVELEAPSKSTEMAGAIRSYS